MKSLFYKCFNITKHKTLEIQLDYDPRRIELEFWLNIPYRTDHAGINLMLTLFVIFLSIEFYDNRHWDDEKRTWKVYDEK